MGRAMVRKPLIVAPDLKTLYRLIDQRMREEPVANINQPTVWGLVNLAKAMKLQEIKK